jgi:hypothetical protein
MTLSALIRKGGLATLATATPATVATQGAIKAVTVAKVATVAVAGPPQPAASGMTAEEETAIRVWLAHIEEPNPVEIQLVLDECRNDPVARDYYLGRAEEVPQPADFDDDDRRRCNQCVKLAWKGRCLAARRGEIETARDFMPVPDLPRRCEGYAPRLNDPDRRPGRERWPGAGIWAEG